MAIFTNKLRLSEVEANIFNRDREDYDTQPIVQCLSADMMGLKGIARQTFAEYKGNRIMLSCSLASFAGYNQLTLSFFSLLKLIDSVPVTIRKSSWRTRPTLDQIGGKRLPVIHYVNLNSE